MTWNDDDLQTQARAIVALVMDSLADDLDAAVVLAFIESELRATFVRGAVAAAQEVDALAAVVRVRVGAVP